MARITHTSGRLLRMGSFTKTLKRFFKASTATHTNSCSKTQMMWAFSLSVENLNTSFPELRVSSLLWVWCPEPRPTTPLTRRFSLFHAGRSCSGARGCGFFSPKGGGEGGSYRGSPSAAAPLRWESGDRLLTEFLFRGWVMALLSSSLSTSQLAWS